MTTKPEQMPIAKSQFFKDKIVKDCMTNNPEVISPDTNIKEVAKKMLDLNSGSLLVGNEEKLTGFVTDRDIVIRAVAEGLDPETVTIDKVTTDKILYCYEDNTLDAVLDNMKDNEVLRLAVLDNNKKLTGVITHGQIAKAAAGSEDVILLKKVAELACYDKVF